MAIRWAKVNWDLINRLRNLSKFSFENGDYIGASVVKMLFLEATLSLATILQLKTQEVPEERISEFSENYPSFSILINYFYTISKDLYAYNELKEVNQKRNRMIHDLLTFKTFDELQQEGRTIYLKADSLEKYLIDKYFKEKPKIEMKSLTAEEIQQQIKMLMNQLETLQRQLQDLQNKEIKEKVGH